MNGSKRLKEWLFLTVLTLWMTMAGGSLVQAQDEAEMKIVTFGTSLTARGGWQDALENRLAQCLAVPVSVKTVARSGAISDWGLSKVTEVVALHPDIVVIEFYANDASLHRFVSVAGSSDNIAAILKDLRAGLPKARLIVQVMNPISGMRGYIRPFLDSYIDAHLSAARSAGAEIVDHRAAWAQMAPEELDSAIPDGAHPLPAAATAVIVPELAARIAGRAC